MGIKGFHQAFREDVRRKNIKDYEGQRVAIDGYAWLHRAVHKNKTKTDGHKSDKFVRYFK